MATMRHSCAHVMARAVMRLKKHVQLAFGPTTDSGFYYDFEVKGSLTEDDFPAIEDEMRKIIELDEPFERIERPRTDAIQICKDLQQEFKVEHIQEGLADHETLSFYQSHHGSGQSEDHHSKGSSGLGSHAAQLCPRDGPSRDETEKTRAAGVWTDYRQRFLL